MIIDFRTGKRIIEPIAVAPIERKLKLNTGALVLILFAAYILFLIMRIYI